MLLYALLASFGLGLLYAQTTLTPTASPAKAVACGGLVFITSAISFLAPPRWFRYSHTDAAPRVMNQVINRAFAAALIAIATNAAVWFIVASDSISLLEELYAYTLLVIFLFHGLGGAIASHVMYLQATRQYNSDQLIVVLATVTLLLFVLVLYFLAFDWAIPRDGSIHVRDLIAVTLVLIGYGRSVYLMAHH